jgi:hypothetical protein
VPCVVPFKYFPCFGFQVSHSLILCACRCLLSMSNYCLTLSKDQGKCLVSCGVFCLALLTYFIFGIQVLVPSLDPTPGSNIIIPQHSAAIVGDFTVIIALLWFLFFVCESHPFVYITIPGFVLKFFVLLLLLLHTHDRYFRSRRYSHNSKSII